MMMPVEPRHFVRLFQPRFAALVESGAKCQTVRPVPKRMPRPGDTLSLRCWVGAPYRSKQRVLREAVVERVLPISIHDYVVRAHRRNDVAFSRGRGVRAGRRLFFRRRND